MRRVVFDERSGPTQGGALRRHHGAWYWVLTRNRMGGREGFTERTREGQTLILPVFHSEEDARAYLWDDRGARSPRKTGRGELVSVLMGVCAGVR